MRKPFDALASFSSPVPAFRVATRNERVYERQDNAGTVYVVEWTEERDEARVEKKRGGGEGGGRTDSQALPDSRAFLPDPFASIPSRSFCFRIRIRRPRTRIGKRKRTIARALEQPV